MDPKFSNSVPFLTKSAFCVFGDNPGQNVMTHSRVFQPKPHAPVSKKLHFFRGNVGKPGKQYIYGTHGMSRSTSAEIGFS